jgi:hypothetical protein
MLALGCDSATGDPTDAAGPLQKDHGFPLAEDGGPSDDDAGAFEDGAHIDVGPCGERSANAGSTSICGAVDLIACTECQGVHECGRGESNFVPIVNCPNCPGRVDSHVCEAGACRTLGLPGALRVRFSIPSEAAGAASFISVALNSVAANGDRLRCAELQSSCTLIDNPALNATNVAFQLFNAPADPGLIYVTTFGAEAGAERIVMLIVTTEASGGGDVVAVGCLEDVSIGTESPTEIAIEVGPK